MKRRSAHEALEDGKERGKVKRGKTGNQTQRRNPKTDDKKGKEKC